MKQINFYCLNLNTKKTKLKIKLRKWKPKFIYKNKKIKENKKEKNLKLWIVNIVLLLFK